MSDENKTTDAVAIPEFSTVQFLSEIESAEKMIEKVGIINRVLNKESAHVLSMKKQMEKKGKKFYGQDYNYIPIAIVEEALRQVFFRQIDFKIVQAFRDLNSFIVVAMIRYKDPVTLEYRECDGIGAQPLQQDKGAKIADFNMTMKYNALELGVGTAYSTAIKNAAKRIGRLFGANINRDEDIATVNVFQGAIIKTDEQKAEEITELLHNAMNMIDPFISFEASQNIQRILELKETESYDSVISELEKSLKK